MEIRKAVAKDVPDIASFQVAMALETEDKKLDSEIVTTAAQAVIDDPAKGFYLVAEDDGLVVASLLITYEWSDWRNSNMWYIQSVFVRKENRGQGIFKKMYQVVYDMAQQNGVMFVRLYVETENVKAQKVYEALGMKRMPYFMYDVRVN